MNITESNKLIAEFMGMKKHHNDNSMMVKITSQGNEVVLIDTLQYHSSWDWLIPVIDKIKSSDKYPKYADYSSSIIGEGGIYINTKFISVTYNNVIDFINWYNKLNN